MIVRQGGRRVLLICTGDRVVGLEPPSGKLLWEYPRPAKQMPIAIPTPAIQGDRVFLASFYEGSLMLRLKADGSGVEKVWERHGLNERQTDAIHPIISTPLFLGEYVYGVDSYGELRCLDAATGDRVWESLEAVPK